MQVSISLALAAAAAAVAAPRGIAGIYPAAAGVSEYEAPAARELVTDDLIGATLIHAASRTVDELLVPSA